MKIRFLQNTISTLLFALLLLPSSVFAEGLIMARINQGFPETMSALQAAIVSQGYKVSRVQRVDIGLTKSGFKTDKYRVVFFGTAEQNAELASKYPDLIPYLPLKVSIFAEESDTILVSNNPEVLAPYFKGIPQQIFEQWSHDIHAIFSQVKASE